MVAWRFPVVALLLSAWPAIGTIFRHAAETSHAAGSVVGKAAHLGAKSTVDAAEVRRVAGLLDVEKDLETDRKKDDVNLRELESQIVALVHKRDASKRDEARKDREIAFLQSSIGKAAAGATAEASAEVAQENQQESKAQADLNVDAAIASADQVVKQAEASGAVVRREEKVDTSAQMAAEAAEVRRRQKASAEASAEAEAQRKAQAAAAAEAEAAEAEKKRKAAAAAEAAQESRAAFEARIRAEAEEKARMKIQAEQEAEARLRAEVEAKTRVKIEAENAAKKKAEQEVQEAADRKAQDKQKESDKMADSADDSFKDFMKEEDGEDQQGDADYEDSANALAGAIGWDRKEIETKADSAVKQLTEAIGGKKVVQSLQGMMAGVR